MLPILLVLVPLLAMQTAGPPGATCRSVGSSPPRTWRFVRVGPHWQLAHWIGDAEKTAVRLTLPAATAARFSATEVHLQGRSSNGGIAVSLTGTPSRALLDVYVSYELEVNVDTALTPAIDELNTDGQLGVRCEVG